MEGITYDVRIWKMDVYKGKEVTTYTVRWKAWPSRGSSPSETRPKLSASRPS